MLIPLSPCQANFMKDQYKVVGSQSSGWLDILALLNFILVEQADYQFIGGTDRKLSCVAPITNRTYFF